MIPVAKFDFNRNGSVAFDPAGIDAGVFDGLLDIIGADALIEVLDSCRRQFEASQPLVTTLLAARDLVELRHLTHDLKSSALNVGLTDLCSLARDIETACREGRNTQALDMAEDLPRRLRQACATLDAINHLH